MNTVAALLKEIPASRVLFGSHTPFLYTESALLKIQYAETGQKEKDAIVCPQGISDDDYIPDKKRFDPRKWIVKAEKAVQNEVESLVQISGSSKNSILR